VNAVSTDAPPVNAFRLEDVIDAGELIINLRAEGDPEVLLAPSETWDKLPKTVAAARDKMVFTTLDKERDVALLLVRALQGKPLKVTDKSDFYVGETIYTLGNPKGLEGTFSNGIISNFLRMENTFYMQFTAPVSPGNSGGPVLDNTGEVIGMVNMQLKEGQNLNFAILAVHVRMLMDGRHDLPSDTYMDNNLGPPPSRRKPN